MDVTSNRSQHQIKNGDIVCTHLPWNALHGQNVEMLLTNKIQPTALANGLVPVDIDVTPMDNSKSKKEGVSRTYKGVTAMRL